MRKPLVVVCVVASTVLLAGAIAATTAGANTTSEQPEVPGLALPDAPDMPQVPQLPAADGRPAFDLPGLVAQAQDQADQSPDQADQSLDQADQESPADQDAPAQRPGGQDAAQKPAVDPVRQKPDQEQPGQDEPAQEQPAKQHPAASAQHDLSPGSISGSVDAPVQRQVLSLVNENRRRGGCDDLTLDRRLIAAANRHAADMARREYFAHRSPDGRDAGERVEDAGYRWARYGENIARGQDSAYEVVDGWMHSPEHRENIMDCLAAPDGHRAGLRARRHPVLGAGFRHTAVMVPLARDLGLVVGDLNSMPPSYPTTTPRSTSSEAPGCRAGQPGIPGQPGQLLTEPTVRPRMTWHCSEMTRNCRGQR